MTTREFITSFKKSTGRLPSQVELSKQLKMSPKTAIQALMKYVKEDTQEHKKENALGVKKHKIIYTLRIFLVLLSIMAFILSVYFTGLWFVGRFPFIIAGLISLSMVLFMVIAPQTSRYVEHKLTKTVVWFSFSIALLFSMGSTISGQYEATSKARAGTRDTFSVYSTYEISEKELLYSIEEARAEKSIHQRTLEMLSSTKEDRLENWQQIATERKYIDKFNEKIDQLTSDLRGVRDNKLIELSKGSIENRKDFYSFVSGLIKMDIELVEFWVSALPAIFIDLIAALCLNLALFLKERES